MSLVTAFLNLVKPEGTEKHSRTMINGNYDKIDESVGKLGGHKVFDSVEVNTGFFTGVNPNLTVSAQGIYRRGNFAYFFVDFTNPAQLGTNTDTGGFIGGTVGIMTLNLGYRPILDAPLSGTTTADRVVSGFVATSGLVGVRAVGGNATVFANTRFKMAGILFLPTT